MSMKKKVITLISSDGERFEVEEAMAIQSEMIKYMVEADCVADGIPLSGVKSDIMPKIIEYMKKHVGDSSSSSSSSSSGTTDINAEWDSEFINSADQAVLYKLIMASNYLEIKGLLNLVVQRVADMIKGKTVEQIRETFNIENDFSPEEEEKIRKENPWAFD